MRAALACAILALALGSHAAGNVAFVCDIKGSATIEGDGRLAFLAELAPGTRLLLGTNASACIAFAASGSEFTLAGPGEFLVTPTEMKAEKGTVPARRAVATLQDTGVVSRASQAATASLRMRGIVPGAVEAVMAYPVDARIATLQPPLRLKDPAKWEAATLVVQDASGKEVWKGGAGSAAARLPVKLSPGTRYTWRVMNPAGAAGEARFETLPADSIAKAEKSRAGARRFADRLLHAFLLEEIGAVQDAREQWAALARERPDLPELAVLAR
jgi:hypothetical protein